MKVVLSANEIRNLFDVSRKKTFGFLVRWKDDGKLKVSRLMTGRKVKKNGKKGKLRFFEKGKAYYPGRSSGYNDGFSMISIEAAKLFVEHCDELVISPCSVDLGQFHYPDQEYRGDLASYANLKFEFKLNDDFTDTQNGLTPTFILGTQCPPGWPKV